MHLTRGELWILGWLEREGFRADVYTDLDFHNDGCDAAQYACLVVGTHPEYWTTQMYDNAMSYLDAGGSLLYIAGNGIFEVGEYDNQQMEMIFRLGIEGGPREDALFRQLGRPERSLLGIATERCGVTGSPFIVQFADHELFAGTGVSDGDIFGDAGLNTGFGNGKASAWEVDTSNGPGATSTAPADCAMTPAGRAAVRPPRRPHAAGRGATGRRRRRRGHHDLRPPRRRIRLLRRLADVRRQPRRRPGHERADAQRAAAGRGRLTSGPLPAFPAGRAQAAAPTGSRGRAGSRCTSITRSRAAVTCASVRGISRRSR